MSEYSRERIGDRPDAGTVLRRFALPATALYLLLLGAGWLLGHPFAEFAEQEDVVNRDLAAYRTAEASTVTKVLSIVADTEAVIAVLLVAAVLLRIVHRRWGEALTLVAGVLLQGIVFLLTTIVVDRERPDVTHLDEAPPTSSFPSGHTGAATALYVGIAVLVAWRLRHTLLRVALTGALVAVPLAVAVSRLYRGMHHPTDVVFGALNGLLCLGLAVWTFRPEPARVNRRT